MDQVSCSGCGAAFDVTADLPAVFTCGACGGEVRLATGPRSPSRRAAAPARGEASPRRMAHHYRDEIRSAAGKDRTVIWLAVGAALVFVVGGSFLFFSTGSKASDVTPPSPPPPPPAPVVEVAKEPAEVAAARPEPSAAEPEPEESGSPELVRVKRAAKRARSAQEHFEAAKLGRGQLEAARKSQPQSPEIGEFERLIKAALESAVNADPAFEAAHVELGHLRYSQAEVETWIKSDLVPTKLRTALEETVADVGSGAPVRWLSGDVADKHAGVLDEARALHEDRSATKVSWFYTKATSAAKRIEGEVGIYLSESRDQDAFDPVIFRPYVLLVQKDPKERSVDRAYEVVQLIRTLEDTWRRRYAKEIEFSGSMAAPPIILLRSRKDYEKYQTRHETAPVVSAGHYEPHNRRMVIYKSSPEEERVVIFHEGTHMLFDHKNSAKDAETQVKQSMWFSEGIAEYFGGHGPSGERDPVTQSPIWEPGRVNDTRIGSIALARAVKKLIAFQDLLKITRAEWSKRNVKDRLWSEMTYAQGWALVYYLNHGESGKYQKDFVEYMKLELTGQSGTEAFEKIFGKHGLDKIEKEYAAFLDFIITKHKQKKISGGKILD